MMAIWLTIVLATILSVSVNAGTRNARSIDLIAAHNLVPDHRLPKDVSPISYILQLEPYPVEGYFEGNVKINVTIHETVNHIVLNVGDNLKIVKCGLTQIAQDDESNFSSKASASGARNSPVILINTLRSDEKPHFVLFLSRPTKRGAQFEIDISFTGKLFNDTSEGIFRNFYLDPATKTERWFVATHFRPNFARTAFPCFDEPSFKATIQLTISRKEAMSTISNALLMGEQTHERPGYVWDIYEPTLPISTFSFGFVVSDFSSITLSTTEEGNTKHDIRVWGRTEYIPALHNVTDKVFKSMKALESFWNCLYPFPKIDVVALPNYHATRPADNWALLLFKESELSGKGSWHITQEMVYQWLGASATPYWWSDAHINNALARYVTAYVTIQMEENETFNNWPLTMLYSIYYEFSKRYPHGKNTAIKQDSASAKTELLFRMFNYTLGETTFKKALQKFMIDRQYRTFFSDDVWSTINLEARIDGVLDRNVSVTTVAGSWIAKDRLPVVTVTRDYRHGTIFLKQRVYLRERPHDVPDKGKFLWWIPIVLIEQENLDFTQTRPKIWMDQEEDILMPTFIQNKNNFIIVNPEEIGPFPVNYDETNWRLLSKYLCTENRTQIPVITRAKLLHDSWNLAYAGDLDFGIALNMTLFLQNERDYLAWVPFFTLIDHIGRHIDSIAIHTKFLSYVRLLLTPLYEDLGPTPIEGESEGQAHLRSSTKIFLCQAGYRPCVREAQAAFKKWMQSPNPDDGNPVPNQYICPVFKWGTPEEWDFGLQRVIQFPSSRKQNERTYLLKTLAGCPNDSSRIEKLLNITILEQNKNFSDNDIYLIFSMLTGSTTGYTTLFEFLTTHFNAIKMRFDGKLHLWNTLITSATSVFKTQHGLDKVSTLYSQRKHEFGTADFVVEKALKTIAEEAQWSNVNLPVIEKWLTRYLRAPYQL